MKITSIIFGCHVFKQKGFIVHVINHNIEIAIIIQVAQGHVVNAVLVDGHLGLGINRIDPLAQVGEGVGQSGDGGAVRIGRK